MRKFIIFSLVFVFVLSGYFGFQYVNNSKVQTVLEKYDLDGLTVIEMVSSLDQRIDEPSTFGASISPTTLTLYDDGNALEFAIPDDQFYVSFAPYINNTHPCTQHNLVSCRGELKSETFHIIITQVNGTVLIDETIQSMDSGFIGLWLPKDIEARLYVEYDGLSVEIPIATLDESDTCITTPLQLKAA